ncbi:MAG: lamin tail domain-containing protein [Planctomycetota bacterium]|nr:lamin tail domain-containing protein [Planctomycetota bacterium]
MKKTVMGLLALVCCAGSASAQVLISQVYGGGGNTGAPFNQDFVELRNTASVPVTVPAGGWSLQYASAGGNWASSSATLLVIPAGTVIPANGFFLIGGATGTAGSPLPTTPDLNPSSAGSFNMSGTAGKVALVSIATSLNVNDCTRPEIINFVTWGNPGSVPSCNDGSYALLPSGTGATTSIVRLSAERCQETGSDAADFTTAGVGSVPIYNSQSPGIACPTCIDCNGNQVCDNVEIDAAGGSGGVGGTLDCNSDGLIDSCQIAGNPALDCDVNGTLDACQIAANPALDCDSSGTLDSCQIASTPYLDSCNSNGLLDSCETPGAGQDCNANNVLDCYEIKTGIATDADFNGTIDQCEGGFALETIENATVQPTGIRGGGNGNNFWNIEGSGLGNFASYGAVRFDLAPLFAQLDAAFPGGWTVNRVYFYLQQANAAFTFSSLNDSMQLYYTDLDALDITVQSSVNPARLYANFETDWTDRDLVTNYTFTQDIGTGPDGIGSGKIESYLMFNSTAMNNSAMLAVGAEANQGDTTLTLLVNTNDAIAAATYAGRTNNTWRGPSLVVFAESTGAPCDPDFNQDGNSDQDDIACLAQVVAGDPTCSSVDPDFNRDGNVDQDDIAALEQVVAGAPCP